MIYDEMHAIISVIVSLFVTSFFFSLLSSYFSHLYFLWFAYDVSEHTSLQFSHVSGSLSLN